VRATVIDLAPRALYNFGGISSIMLSVEEPELTERVNVGAVEAILSAMDQLASHHEVRFLQAASGAIFEGADVAPQDEATPPAPRSPYARAKARTLELVEDARARGRFATAAILYNHESPLRGHEFVTRRITSAVARIAAGLADDVELGNLDVRRDWGWAPDYVRGMRLVAEAERPDDFVLATGRVHTLDDFLRLAFEAAGIADWRDRVRSTASLQRSVDPHVLCGDSSRAQRVLGWRHTRSFADIAVEMVAFDRRLLDDPDALWREE
jgi:GDPmannose 4,6-dehydratase